MTSYSKHVTGYLITAAILTIILEHYHHIPDPLTLFMGLGIGSIASLLPDIDTPSSKARKALNILFLSAIIALTSLYLLFLREDLLLYIIIFLAGTQLSLWFLKHRGLTHNPLVCFVLSAMVVYYSVFLGLYFLTGYVSHLFLDYASKKR